MENDKMYISIHDIELIGDILDELAIWDIIVHRENDC